MYTGCLVLVRWNVTVYIKKHPTVSAAECVVVLRLAVNIINNHCCCVQGYNAAIWWTIVAKLATGLLPDVIYKLV